MSEERKAERPAIEKIHNWLGYQGAQLWLSHRMSVGQPTVSRWLSGSCVPAAHYRQAMAALSMGMVEFDDWYTPRERAIAHRFDNWGWENHK